MADEALAQTSLPWMYSEPAVGRETRGGVEPPSYRVAAGCLAVWLPRQECPRQESNLVHDLRTVVCRPSHSKGDIDKQGRVLVPPDLARHAGLGKEVAVVGVHDHIEIWGRPEWAAHVSAIEGSVGDVAERAADRRG